MRVAVVHYHLRPGGVTRVIHSAVTALASRRVRTVVLAGQNPQPAAGENVRIIPGLDYDSTADPAELVRDMRSAAHEALGGPPDLWHVHNASLGRNLPLIRSVAALASAGEALLLQLHDFAEDGRPGIYRQLRKRIAPGEVHPSGPRVHYAVLNERDARILRAAGGGERVHLLPNATPALTPLQRSPAKTGGRLFLYPTRAIRRKNIGEFLLWSAIAEDGDRFAATLAPTAPSDREPYERWIHVADELKLPVEWEASKKAPDRYSQLLEEADALVTTSVAEGFGLAFLEPWQMGRPLAGRNLPEITSDFARAGLKLDHLYERLDVPLEWVGEERFRSELAAKLDSAHAAYGRQPTADATARAFAAAVTDGRVDVGRLDERMQERVLRRLRANPGSRDQLKPPALPIADDRIAHNARVVDDRFNLELYGERLAHLYSRAVMPGRDSVSLEAETILDEFLKPERFCLLRT